MIMENSYTDLRSVGQELGNKDSKVEGHQQWNI